MIKNVKFERNATCEFAGYHFALNPDLSWVCEETGEVFWNCLELPIGQLQVTETEDGYEFYVDASRLNTPRIIMGLVKGDTNVPFISGYIFDEIPGQNAVNTYWLQEVTNERLDSVCKGAVFNGITELHVYLNGREPIAAVLAVASYCHHRANGNMTLTVWHPFGNGYEPQHV